MSKVVINGTGHRPWQKNKNDEWISKLAFGKFEGRSRELYDKIVALSEIFLDDLGGRDRLIVRQGCAMGFDLALGRAALNMGIELHSYIPYKNHGQDWRTFYKQEHNEIVAASDFVHDTDQPFSREALLQRNMDMLKGSQLVLAFWDGSPGGTGHCVKNAEKLNIPVYRMWKRWLMLRDQL